MKNYVGISRDHSGSMKSITGAATDDYNRTIDSIRTAAENKGIDVIVNVIKCGVWTSGYYAKNTLESVNSSISVLKPLKESDYDAQGQTTPLWDAVGQLIDIMKNVPDAKDPSVSFTITVITDGKENNSQKYTAYQIGSEIKKLQATDRWSFTFRVPHGYKKELTLLGIPAGNILEWETTERGMNVATEATARGFDTYYSNIKAGVNSTGTFYTDMAGVSSREVKQALNDISKQVRFWDVTDAKGAAIRTFCEGRLRNEPFLKGAAFYQLTKTENEVQEYKRIAIVDKSSGKVYSGPEARTLLGLPDYGTVKVAPGDHGKYDIYIQSTSVNRKLPVGSKVMYWPNIGTAYKS